MARSRTPATGTASAGPTRRPGERRTSRTLALVLSAILAASVLVVAPPVAEAEPPRDPIVFVHGFSGGKSNWWTMVDRFVAAGWDRDDLVVWTYDWSRSNRTIADRLADEVARVRAERGADQVTLVTHSMGGLSSRHFLKELGGTDQVGTWISLGGPNHGTTWAYGCWFVSCIEMRPGSGFLTELNAGDPTPPGTRYATFWSACDAVISPSTSTIIDGADNDQVGCVGHLSLLWDRDVFDRVHDYILG